ARRGYVYDASLLPSWPLWAARSLLTGPSPRDLARAFAPRKPHRSKDRQGALLELPVSCLPALRLPLAAPFLSLLGGEGARLFARLLRRESFVQIRLAGVDLLDPAEAPEVLRA